MPPTPHPAVAPQNWLSLVGSMQLPLQLMSPVVHDTWHWPLEHTWPGPHTLPHEPQLVLSVCVFVQNGLPPSTLHVWRLPPHENAQLPFEQTWPWAHVLPQPPQLAVSLVVLTHEPLHDVSGDVQKRPHLPPLHTWPGWHWLPQLPQLSKSVCVLVQVPVPQSVCPLAQPTEHCPPEHTRPVPHVAPHTPQFFGSLLVFTHVPPHDVLPVPQLLVVESPAESTPASPVDVIV